MPATRPGCCTASLRNDPRGDGRASGPATPFHTRAIGLIGASDGWRRAGAGFAFGEMTMKFTQSWLRDHLETEASLDAILDALTDLGLEVEEVADPAARLGAFRIARIIEASPHPDADR